MCPLAVHLWRLNPRGDISTLNGKSLKLVDKFIYLGSNVASTENYINTRLTKASTAIDWLLVIWKSDKSDKIKRSFFSKKRSCQYYYMDAPHWRWQSIWRMYWTNPGGNILQNSSCTAIYPPSQKPSGLDEPDMQDTAGEVNTNS